MSDIVVVAERAPNALGLYLKAPSTGRLYRVEPARDPAQPRFWCLCIYRCTPAGVADRKERPWLGGGGMTRDELPEALRLIREDVDTWLDASNHRRLRKWLLEADGLSSATSVARTGQRASSPPAATPLANASLDTPAPGPAT